MINTIISIVKTLYVNFKCFDFNTARKLPVFIGAEVSLKGLRHGCIILNTPIKRGMVSMGRSYGSTDYAEKKKSHLVFGKFGIIVFSEKFRCSGDFHISVNGILKYGYNFNSNYGMKIICHNEITIGDDCLFGWNCTLLDSDGHTMTIDGKTNMAKPITVGNKVWLGAETVVLKGSTIGNNSVIGYRSVICGEYSPCSIVTGLKSKTIKQGNIQWMK